MKETRDGLKRVFELAPDEPFLLNLSTEGGWRRESVVIDDYKTIIVYAPCSKGKPCSR